MATKAELEKKVEQLEKQLAKATGKSETKKVKLKHKKTEVVKSFKKNHAKELLDSKEWVKA